MKKPTILLIVIGSLCMSFTLVTRHLFTSPAGLNDFLTGLGVAMIIGALFVQRKLERQHHV